MNEEAAMNEEMKNDETSDEIVSHKESIQDVWNALSFPFKEQLTLNANEEVVLSANDFRKEKTLFPFQNVQIENEVKKLQDNYEKLQLQSVQLQEQYNTTADKLQLRPAIRTLEQQLSAMNAIGDFNIFSRQINECKTAIEAIYDANAAERKMLVTEAKALTESTEWQSATEQFKQIIEKWKSAPEIKRSINESLWQEISDAKDAFFEKKRKHYEELEKEQMVNLDRKIELCEKAAALAPSEDWKSTTDKLNQLMEEWKAVGPLPSAEKNDEMWDRFNGSRKQFFDRKHEHSDHIKIEQERNYIEKLKLVEEAELLSTSTDWKSTADRLDAMQQVWDGLGRAPKEFNDDLWNRWRSSRNAFYEAKRAHAKAFISNLNENYEKKKILTERAEHLSKTENWKLATDELTQLMTEWKTIGPIPKEHGDDLWNRFNEARRLFFKRKDEDREKRQKRFEQRARTRLSQTEQFYLTLQDELKDDEEQMVEFQTSIKDLNEDHKKDKELKDHLTNLIQKLEINIEKRKAKIEDVKKQMDGLS